MKPYLIAILLLPMLAMQSGNAYLDKVPQYNTESYYKEKVYAEKDWKSFSELADAKKIVDPKNYDLHLLNAAVTFAGNKMREEKKLKQLKFSSALRDAALIHTHEMVTRKFFDHYNRKDRKLYSPAHRIQMFIANPAAIAENCDENFIAPSEQISYWQMGERIIKHLYGSPPHRENMLSKSYDYVGWGVVFETQPRKGGAYFLKATQDFSKAI